MVLISENVIKDLECTEETRRQLQELHIQEEINFLYKSSPCPFTKVGNFFSDKSQNTV